MIEGVEVFGFGQFWQVQVEGLGVHDENGQVRLREEPVIVGSFLGALGAGLLPVRILVLGFGYYGLICF